MGFEVTSNSRDTSPSRTMPPFITAHTFCAPWVGPRNSGVLRTVLAKIKVFYMIYGNVRRADVSKSYLGNNKVLRVSS